MKIEFVCSLSSFHPLIMRLLVEEVVFVKIEEAIEMTQCSMLFDLINLNQVYRKQTNLQFQPRAQFDQTHDMCLWRGKIV